MTTTSKPGPFAYPDIVQESFGYHAIEGWNIADHSPVRFIKEWANRPSREPEEMEAYVRLGKSLAADPAVRRALIRTWKGWTTCFGGSNSDEHMRRISQLVMLHMGRLGMMEPSGTDE